MGGHSADKAHHGAHHDAHHGHGHGHGHGHHGPVFHRSIIHYGND